VTTSFRIVGIDAAGLTVLRAAGRDVLGNSWQAHAAQGWEPLRCCLTVAEPRAPIALISYSPSPRRSAWSEVGPVFVHDQECDGFTWTGSIPAHLRFRRQVLRPYHLGGAINYDQIRLLHEDQDLAAALPDVVGRDDVAWVDIRSAEAQCWSCTAVRAPSP
jgi:hypothetical protein